MFPNGSRIFQDMRREVYTSHTLYLIPCITHHFFVRTCVAADVLDFDQSFVSIRCHRRSVLLNGSARLFLGLLRRCVARFRV